MDDAQRRPPVERVAGAVRNVLEAVSGNPCGREQVLGGVPGAAQHARDYKKRAQPFRSTLQVSFACLVMASIEVEIFWPSFFASSISLS